MRSFSPPANRSNVLAHRRAPRRVVWGALVACAVVAATSIEGAGTKFFSDDPLWTVPDSQDASKMMPLEPDLAFDVLANSFGHPGDPTANVRAKDINTIDEVPDSSWFSNRAGKQVLTTADIERGPDTTRGPAPGQWTVSSAKSDGVTPGFTVRDTAGTLWFVKFDPPGRRAMATGTEVVVTKLLWALGYHVAENHLAQLREDQLAIGSGATITPVGETERPLNKEDIRKLLARADRDADGSYRTLASKALEGKPIGRIEFFGTRPDDPNDTIPHEHRRALRGYGVFAAWLNHVDAKAINSRDMLVTVNGRTFVRHNLLDFGSALGSGSVAPHEYWEGFESLMNGRQTAANAVTFGFRVPRWRTMPFYEAPSIGRFPQDNTKFDPSAWRPRVPNAAFVRARADDRFWAAQKLSALSDDLIRAAVRTGQFGDEAAEAFLGRALIERRDAILRAYIPAINPIVSPALDNDGTLTFENAAVSTKTSAAPEMYQAVWSRFDNTTGEVRGIGETSGSTTTLRAPAGLPANVGDFVRIEIRAQSTTHASWTMPVHAYFTRTGQGWRLVGFERMPS